MENVCYHYVKQGASSDPVNNWKSPAVAHQSWTLTAFFEALSNGFSLLSEQNGRTYNYRYPTQNQLSAFPESQCSHGLNKFTNEKVMVKCKCIITVEHFTKLLAYGFLN